MLDAVCTGSIATTGSGKKWLNDVVGCISSTKCSVHRTFKAMHLQHHKHTNDEASDPDAWSTHGSYWSLPLRWLTQEFYYYVLYLPILHTRPATEATCTSIQLATVLACYTVAGWTGHFTAVLYGWIIPARLASMLLACTFGYLPHRPHNITRAENPYKATAVTSLVQDITWPLTWPLLYQNYHNIHHLCVATPLLSHTSASMCVDSFDLCISTFRYPYVPFYLYESIWRAMKPKLLAAGTQIIPVIGPEYSKTS